MKRFGDLMREYGRSGEFTVPMELERRRPRWIALSMAALDAGEGLRLAVSALVRRLCLP